MRAIALKAPGGLDKLMLVERNAPSAPAAGEISVTLHGGSLNFHDLLVVLGQLPTADGRIPLSDGAGIVDAIGPGVTDFAVGDHVVSTFFPDWITGPATIGDFQRVPGDGLDGYARTVVVAPATSFTRTPEGYDACEAATITTAGLTAWRALVVDGNLKAGDTVLVLGTGGVSIWALQIAKMMGASCAVTSSSGEKLERAKALGADFVANYKEQSDWGSKVRNWAGGGGVDHVIEVGGPATLTQSIDAVRVGGHISLIGILTGAGGDVPTAALMTKQARLQGLIVGSRNDQQAFVRALEANAIRPVIDQRFALEDISAAFRLQQTGGHFGKIVLHW